MNGRSRRIAVTVWAASALVTAARPALAAVTLLSLRQQQHRLDRGARGDIGGGAVDLDKIVTRDEPVERHRRERMVMVEPSGIGMAPFTLRAAGDVRSPQFGSAEGGLDAEMVAIAGAIIR